MRTTVDYRDSLFATLQERSEREGRSFKDTVNDCLERGLGMVGEAAPAWSAPVYHAGAARDLSAAWELVEGLEIDAYQAKRDLAK